MTYQLILTEKPAAAAKIASALAEGKPSVVKKDGVSYYRITREGADLVVACAVGHLYNLAGIQKGDSGKKVKARYTYPVMEVEWKPSYLVSKSSEFTKKYLTVIIQLAKTASSFVIATDYDIEGELIGLNILRFACGRQDAFRMKYSTLTTHELQESFEKKSEHINWNLARAGETRHVLDWLYGINISRALTLALKQAGTFRVLSSGRVQGPALKIIVDRDKEIAAFIPIPYWELFLHLKPEHSSKEEILAEHVHGRFLAEPEARAIYERVQGKPAQVSSLESSEQSYPPPVPFDLTTFQLEVNRCFGITPKMALDIAQKLYLGGYISYPRTSSQKLPPSIGYKRILTGLAKDREFSGLCEELLAKPTLTPAEGKKTDSAHPAIFPTGILPKKDLGQREMKLYAMVVRRFLATFADPAVREHLALNVECGGEMFRANGMRTLKPGWQRYYAPFVKIAEVLFPPLKKGQALHIHKSEMLAKETQPPKRYSQASLVRELSRRNLGTKATRAVIVENLFERGYVFDTSMKATSLGVTVVETLGAHCPKILDEKLTRGFEKEMEKIEAGTADSEQVLSKARKLLLKILKEFKEQEAVIGGKLLKASKESWLETHELGACKACGGTLVVRRGKFGSFVACTGYPACTVSFSLPRFAKVVRTDKACEACGYPIVKLIKRRPQELCINPGCPTKQLPKALEKELSKGKRMCPNEVCEACGYSIVKKKINAKSKQLPEEEEKELSQEKKDCPKCEKPLVLRKCGKPLVLRKSIYGEFLGCSGYPKCHYIENVARQGSSGKKEEKEKKPSKEKPLKPSKPSD